MTLRVGILTVSDRCSRGLKTDESGPRLKELVEKEGWKAVQYGVVPDEISDIGKILKDWCDRKKIQLILTTGGTGLSPRDVTPEATKKVVEKEIPGFSELMRSKGYVSTPKAALSRAVVGSRKKSLILNLPGSPKGAAESLSAVLNLIPHAVEILKGANHDPTTSLPSGDRSAADKEVVG